MTSQEHLAFGVEFELLLKPKSGTQPFAELEKDCPGWAEELKKAKAAEKAAEGKGKAEEQKAKQRAEQVRKHFRKAIANALRTRANIRVDISSPEFDEWAVKDEVTLDEPEGYCRVEFVSRVTSSIELWQLEFDDIFLALASFFHVQKTTGCSMHVHVSPRAQPTLKEHRWSAQQLNRILKAISYFNRPITKIMPAERKDNPFAKANMESEEIAKGNPDLKALYEKVTENTWKPLFDYYDSKLKMDIHKRIVHSQIMAGCRYVAWNFEHITDTCGTIEHRRGPAVSSAASAKHWTIFALGFLASAAYSHPDPKVGWSIDWNTAAKKKTHPSVGELAAFVQAGIRILGSSCQGALKPQGIEEDKHPAKLWNSAEMEALLKKKANLDTCPDPDSYVAKASRTPGNTPEGSPFSSTSRRSASPAS